MASKARDAFRTISEVADWLDVPAHVLRFWESKFTQIKPVKRAGGRRYYRPDDMLLIGGIKKLLHDDGMTIRGVQKMLKEDGVKSVSAQSQSLDGVDEAASERTLRRKAAVADTHDEVEDAVEQDASVVAAAPPEELPAEDQEAVDAWNADAQQEAAAQTSERPPLEVTATSDDAEDNTQEEAGTGDAETEPMEDPMPEYPEDDVPEAPFIEVEEEEPQFGGDNVVELSPRAEPVAEPVVEDEAPAASEPAEEAPAEEAQPEVTEQATAPEAEAFDDPEPQFGFDLGPVEDAVVEPVVEDVVEPEPEPEPEIEAEAAPVEQEQTEPEIAADPEAPALDDADAAEAEAEAEPDPEPKAAPSAPIPETVEEGFQLTPAQVTAQALKRKLRGTDVNALTAGDDLASHVARLQALRDRLAGELGQ